MTLESNWFEIPDDDAEAPHDDHAWGCECPECAALYEQAGRLLATPEELDDGEPWHDDDVIALPECADEPPRAA